jgi:deoxyribonuclease IV
MVPLDRRLGAHLPVSAGMLKTLDRAEAIGADALQIFSDNPTAWRRRRARPPELAAFRDGLATRDIRPLTIHASYLINLPGPDEATYRRSIELLGQELSASPGYGARYVNVHIGSHRGTGVEEGVRRLADGIEAALARAEEPARATQPDRAGEPAPAGEDDTAGEDATEFGPPSTLVLENSAGGGGGLGTGVEELAQIADRLAERGIGADRVAFCIDTAHAWGAGIDMSDPVTIDAFLGAFDERIGLDRVALVHLNDTRSGLGSRTDRHEHLGAGRIGATGLGHVIRHPGLAHAPGIIETPGMDVGYDAVNLARARALLAGDELRPLPAEAFDLVGSARGRTASTRRRASSHRASSRTKVS